MGLYLGAARKLNFWSEQLQKIRAPCRAPQMALKLIVSVPSLLRAYPSIDRVCDFSRDQLSRPRGRSSEQA